MVKVVMESVQFGERHIFVEVPRGRSPHIGPFGPYGEPGEELEFDREGWVYGRRGSFRFPSWNPMLRKTQQGLQVPSASGWLDDEDTMVAEVQQR